MKKVLLVLLILVLILLIVIVQQPSAYHVVRSMTIAAPAEAIYPHVENLRQWEAWSPWAKIDPDMVSTYDGPEAGIGASHHWAGNKEVGEGRMTIIEVTPNEEIRIRLDFIKPFASTCDSGFFFAPEGSNTLVSWTMSGKNDFIGKAFCVFMDMDAMIGGSYELGLSNLAQVVAGGK